MTNLRWNPLGLRWLAHAPGRIARPNAKPAGDNEPCPLCPGNEAMTPPETWALRSSPPDSPGWLVRAVPNLYPAVTGPGMAHEVIVHSPDHSQDLSRSSVEDAELLTAAWASRLDAIASGSGVKFAQISINQGRAAGASLPHPHSQAIGLSVVPPIAEAELLSISIDCPICNLASESLAEENGLTVLCPPWSEYPYEMLIAPAAHEPAYESSQVESQRALAMLLTRWIRALCSIEAVDAYNLILHTSPRFRDVGAFHWHAHLMARIGTFAGIELGAGLPISIVDPGVATEELRQADRLLSGR